MERVTSVRVTWRGAVCADHLRMVFFDFVWWCCTSHAAVVGHAVGDGVNGIVIEMAVMREGTEVVVGVERLMLEV